MRTEQIESLINLTPMKMITENLCQVTKAIAESCDSENDDHIPELVATGKQLLNAVEKLS